MTTPIRFDPQKDGWYFENGGTPDLSWDLYRETYLGIHPTQDPVAAPYDCGFYEIFRHCAKNGNCGGMSLLALALFKYGGYMGFCSPANFYTGITLPDRADLLKAINILQARQFGARGIEHFVDVVKAGNLNNAEKAFDEIKVLLGKGDYPVLSIATGYLGDNAHTVIPYDYDDGPPKILWIWDPNYPYHLNSGRYSGSDCYLVIHGSTNWVYKGSRTYQGSDNGWCFAVPMSVALTKARQPMSPDLIFTELMMAFVSGPGAAVSQISDDEGHTFYKTETDTHLSRGELETDPSKRLEGVGRWPWYAQAGDDQLPGELYFIHRPRGKASLNFTISGAEYKMVTFKAANLIEIDAESPTSAKDVIKMSGLATSAQSLDITTFAEQRNINVKYLRTGTTSAEWRSFNLRNITLSQSSMIMNLAEDLGAMHLSSMKREVTFDMEIQQRFNREVSTSNVGRFSAVPGEVLRVVPQYGSELGETKVEKEIR